VFLDGVKLEIRPEPSAGERRAILEALERGLHAESDGLPGPWWAAGLPGADGADGLRDGAAPQDARRDAGVVEP
jgi:hypothetical protein